MGHGLKTTVREVIIRLLGKGGVPLSPLGFGVLMKRPLPKAKAPGYSLQVLGLRPPERVWGTHPCGLSAAIPARKEGPMNLGIAGCNKER